MRRALTVIALLAAVTAVVLGTGASSEISPRYTVELDNAFGLVLGADVKVAGVRAGKIKDFNIDPKSYRALVEIEIGQRGFGELRKDTFCEARPQSLIGEYFLDCLPGTDPEKLPVGARIPVTQTASTISVDLVNNIMRRPFRERFSILLGELGAALTTRGADLNETIRRANPALRETDKVLKVLGEQRLIIRDLVENADRVVGELSDRRTEVTRFVREARDTAKVSGDRAQFIRGQFQRLPTFLQELTPTMKSLGEAADSQRGALTALNAQAPLLERFLDLLGPFSDASRPAFRTLGGAAREGKEALRLAKPRIPELAAFAKNLPELATNLAITLEHLDNRAFAVEKDPRSPGGQGFTGLEAFLQYVFRQSQATNVYDANSYLLKVSVFLDNLCAQYTDATQAKDPTRDRCNAGLGPMRPGINTPDPTATAVKKAKRKKTRRDRDADGIDDKTGEALPEPAVETPDVKLPDVQVPKEVQELLDKVLPGLNAVPGGGNPIVPDPQRDDALLEFLFGA